MEIGGGGGAGRSGGVGAKAVAGGLEMATLGSVVTKRGFEGNIVAKEATSSAAAALLSALVSGS